MEITVQHVVFIILSLVAVVGALGVVLTRNLFRAALALILSFVGVSGFYILLEAEFLAMVQILVYIGAISILIIFAIMLTRNLMDPEYRAQNEQWIGALVASAILFGILAFVLWQVAWPAQASDMPPGAIEALGQGLVNPDFFLLPFEVASVLLLVALVGAVIIAREY
jgi:NADH-quinone oxidoreductase subunit J